jgi:hypothetical protein
MGSRATSWAAFSHILSTMLSNSPVSLPIRYPFAATTFRSIRAQMAAMIRRMVAFSSSCDSGEWK